MDSDRALSDALYAPRSNYAHRGDTLGLFSTVVKLRTDLAESNLLMKKDIDQLKQDIGDIKRARYVKQADADAHFVKKAEAGLTREEIIRLIKEHSVYCENGNCTLNHNLRIPVPYHLQLGGFTVDNNKDTRMLTFQNTATKTTRPFTIYSDTHSSFATTRLDGTQNWQGY